MSGHPNSKLPERKRKSDEDKKKQRKREERDLEEGLEDTFPASDAIAVTQPVKSTPAKGRD